MADGGGCIPLPPPLRSSPARTNNNVSCHYANQPIWFSMMWGEFCQSCFEITASTALAHFEHFTLKTRIRFQKGGSTPQIPSLGASLFHVLRCPVFP